MMRALRSGVVYSSSIRALPRLECASAWTLFRALFQDHTTEYPILANKLASLGVLAAVKVGKDGAWIARDGKLHRIEPVAVADAIDTNGAGDAWAAGFLFGFLREWPLPACGALASLLGAETVMHMGPIIPDTHFEVLRPRAMALGP